MDNNLKIRGFDIHFDRLGKGFPLLCLSGFGCSHYNYEFIKGELAQNFELIMVDNRGMGKSESVDSEYSILDLAKDAHQVMSSLGHEKFGVMGISMGGFIAQELVLNFPASIQFLVLACTTSSGNEFPNLPKLDEESIRKSYLVEPEVRSKLVMGATVHPTLKINNPAHFEKIHRIRVENTPKMDQLLYQQLAVDQFLERKINLNEIKCPTLIISGREDRFVNPINAEILNKKIPHSEIKFIKDADHHFFMEKPKETNLELIKFMEKNI